MIVSGPVPYDYTAAMRNRKLQRLSSLIPSSKPSAKKPEIRESTQKPKSKEKDENIIDNDVAVEVALHHK